MRIFEPKSKPSTMKNSLSFATSQTVKNAPKKKSIAINPPIIRTLCSYRDFSKRVPTWGGNINVNVNDLMNMIIKYFVIFDPRQ